MAEIEEEYEQIININFEDSSIPQNEIDMINIPTSESLSLLNVSTSESINLINVTTAESFNIPGTSFTNLNSLNLPVYEIIATGPAPVTNYSDVPWPRPITLPVTVNTTLFDHVSSSVLKGNPSKMYYSNVNGTLGIELVELYF